MSDSNVIFRFSSSNYKRNLLVKMMVDDDDEILIAKSSDEENSDSGEDRSADDDNEEDDQKEDADDAGKDNEKLNADGSGMSAPIADGTISTGGQIKKRRSNAKAVECLDELGNVVAQYRSGMEAAAAMGVLHGEISLACRGLKKDVRGYRFRFVGEDWVNSTRIPKHRKSLLDVLHGDEELTTRMSKYRGEVFEKGVMTKGSGYNIPTEVKVRKWTKVIPAGFRLGVPQWTPDKPNPTPELQDVNPKKAMGARKRKRIEKMNALMMTNR